MVYKQTVDRFTLVKFYVPFKRLLKEDKVPITSGHMKHFLMRAEAYLWASSYLHLYHKKTTVIIVSQ